MKYKLEFSPSLDVSSPSVSGAIVGTRLTARFRAWQPSTWPKMPTGEEDFVYLLKRIFEEAILGEIANVIADAQAENGSLEHRGHVVAVALMCALDAVASYGYRGRHVAAFIKKHFPGDYRVYADQIYRVYRCSLVHSWNLFEAAIYPDHTQITVQNGSISFGLLDFFSALQSATEAFLNAVEVDEALMKNTRGRYETLRKSARP